MHCEDVLDTTALSVNVSVRSTDDVRQEIVIFVDEAVTRVFTCDSAVQSYD
jgi:hypothetical protein